MKKYIILCLIAGFAWGNSSAQDKDTARYSQSGMNKTASLGFRELNGQLNDMVARIMKDYADDKEFIASFKKSQALWEQLRDADLAMRFPEREAGWYGSALPMCRSKVLESLTMKRMEYLTPWIEGIPEGDVCSGSVKKSETASHNEGE